MSLTNLVKPLQGSRSEYHFSTGNTLPLVGVPRGLTYWTPQTSDRNFIFDSRFPKLSGFRATHSPSPWMGDYGHFDVMPVVGQIYPTPEMRASAYHLNLSRPDMFQVELVRYGIEARMSASRSCGVFEFRFPADVGDHAAIVLQTGWAEVVTSGEIEIRRDGQITRVYGTSRSNTGGVVDSFACYFVAEIENADVVGTGTLNADHVKDGDAHINAARAGAFLRLRPRGPVLLRVGTSFISHEQARLNLSREIGDRSFQLAWSNTQTSWDDWLERIETVGGSERDRICLYSAMYRVGLFPMGMHEYDAKGSPVHWSPHDGRVQSGVFYTNNGFWDTSRSVYSLLSLIDREGFSEIVDGFLQHYRQGGWLPKWCSPGYRNCMIGSHSDVVIAEAVSAGIGGIDLNEAYEAIRKNAFEPVEGHGKYGRSALNEYIRLGYVPADAATYSVSWTLDNAHCDWAIARVAQKLGRHDDVRVLTERSRNYRNLWHAGVGFMRPKDSKGNWIEPWSEFEWGHAYVEGGPWQHSFHVPHDPQGLAELCGGVDQLVGRLEQMFSTPPRFEIGHYPHEIHEMTEMALANDEEGDFGQYAHSNQPVHGYLWLPASLGRIDWTRKQVARVMRSLYTPETLPGDEDNGEMSAWYVLGALGKIPGCPGSAEFVDVPSPLFDRVIVRP